MDSNHPIRVGIVGCGYQGRLLAQAIARIDTLAVTACVDPVREAAVSVATAAGHANSYASVDELLNSINVDAVVIATPHHALTEVALSAIGAGKHVLVEKPIATSEQDVQRIEEALTTSGVCYMAGYSLRFFVAQQQVYDLLQRGAVGNIQAITAGIGMQPLTGWRNNRAMGGGQLLYLGCHLVDEILWYLETVW
jgi:phthalate 4,5-cis-dihydrodiol dehydrogenase